MPSSSGGIVSRSQRRKPMGRVSNAEAEKLQGCFLVRSEALGEDRYLNRYFACMHPSGTVSRVYVEAHCDPSPLPHSASSSSGGSVSTSLSGDEEQEEVKTPPEKKQRLNSDAASSGNGRSSLKVFPPSADSASLLGDCKLSAWPLKRRHVKVESLATFLQMLLEQQRSVCFFVAPDTPALERVWSALSPALKRERALRQSLRKVIDEMNGEQLRPREIVPSIPPSPLAAAVWLGCKMLHDWNVLLLPRCYPLLWQQRQPQQFSPCMAFAAALTIAETAASCSVAYSPEGSIPCAEELQQQKNFPAAFASSSAAVRQHRRYWMAQTLLVSNVMQSNVMQSNGMQSNVMQSNVMQSNVMQSNGILTQLLLYIEALVEEAGCVHAEGWFYRRHQWRGDLQQLSLQLPVLLPTPGQPQDVPQEAFNSSAAAAAAASPEAAAAEEGVQRRWRKLEEDFEGQFETGHLKSGHVAAQRGSMHSSSPRVAVAGSVRADEAPADTRARLEGDASEEETKSAAAVVGVAATAPLGPSSPLPAAEKGARDAHQEGEQMVCFLSSESVAAAVAIAAAADKEAKTAAETAPSGSGEEAAAAARFAALVRCVCCGFGWNEASLLQLLGEAYEQAFCSNGASTQANKADTSGSPCQGSLPTEARQWQEVRRRLDLVPLWGLYANVWKAAGLDCQRLTDLNAPISRDIFEQLLASDLQRQQVPSVGDSLFFFRKGHLDLVSAVLLQVGSCNDAVTSTVAVQSAMQDQAAAGGCGYNRTCCSLKSPECLSWIEELRVHHIEYFAGFAGLLPPPVEMEPPLAAVKSTAISLHNATQAMPSGSGGDAAGVSVAASLFSFSLQEDPVVLAQREPSQLSETAVGASGAATPADNNTSQRKTSPPCRRRRSMGSANACVPEGLVEQTYEDFLLQADPLRLAARRGQAALLYLQKQLQLQQLIQQQQNLVQPTGEILGTAVLDTSLCPHYRVVCSVATR
ncbi:chloroquine resistance marker related protein [Cyclospora cayetanensis]|uniref:Chloroquine resistance marker related protein n=1 Tax=Cyclospora cayetanensis TaxID=88456 RepID=A0A1D3D3E0_9EIME|nr:chloroquine resistance marker related protein [Cyclospora cayetanensis]